METTIWTFSLSVPFSEWAAIYDSEGVTKMHEAVGLKSLFRGISKEDPSKVCAIQQAPVGIAQKIFEDNKEMIRGAGHVIESTVISAYSDHRFGEINVDLLQLTLRTSITPLLIPHRKTNRKCDCRQ